MRAVRGAACETAIERIGGFKERGDVVIGAVQNHQTILWIASDANDRDYS